MEQGIKIKPSSCSAFNNALHAQFQNQIYRLVDQWPVELSVINVSDELMAEWKKLIDTEIDINREVAATADTARLAELDRLRDDLATYLFSSIRAAKRLPVAAKKEAATRLALIVDRYKGLQRESADEETIHIDGLYTDLDKGANNDDIIELGLLDVLESLREANEDYRKLHSQRTADRAASKLPTAREIRPQSDAIYERVCLLIEASYLICTNKAEKEEIALLADKMNQQIAEIKATWKQSQAQTASETKRPPRRKAEETAE